MKRHILASVAVLLTLTMMTACGRDPHFITDRAYRNEVHNDFEAHMAGFSMLQVRHLIANTRAL